MTLGADGRTAVGANAAGDDAPAAEGVQGVAEGIKDRKAWR